MITQSFAITTNTLGIGGAERQRVSLANALASLGADVTIYVLQAGGALEGELDPRVKVVRTAFFRGSASSHDIILAGTTNTETAFAAISRLRGSRKWAVAVHNPVSEKAPRISRLSLIGALISDNLVALSPTHSDAIASYWGLAADTVIANAIAPAKTDTPTIARRTTITVGFIGRLSLHHKGLDRLLRAIDHVQEPAPKFLIAGTGPDEAEARSLALELGVNEKIEWIGFAHPDDFFPRVDLICVLSRYEAQPLVLLEAAAYGVPVIVSSELSMLSSARSVDSDDPRMVARAIAEELARPKPTPTSSPTMRSTIDMAREHLELSRRRRHRRLASLRRYVLVFVRGSE